MLNERQFYVLAYHELGLLSMQFAKCKIRFRCFVFCRIVVKLRQGSGKDWQGMAVKVKGLKA